MDIRRRVPFKFAAAEDESENTVLDEQGMVSFE